MRRPLKPFVTEYKNPTRRSKDISDNQLLPGLGAGAVTTLNSEGSRQFSPPEDGYEAAMRAADALFAPPSAVREPVPQAAPVAADEPPPSLPTTPPRAGGRILEAIDETPVDPFAALEAERAPKRRGRKPGSKNKPKAPIAEPQDAVAVPMQAVARHSLVNAGQAKTAASKRRGAPVAASEPQATVAILATDRPQQGARTGARFAWVRTTLRPGERWKRRLPKVAW